MDGLWQEFYNLGNDMTYRGKIQQDIAEMYLKLQRSREEEAQAKQELDAFLEEAGSPSRLAKISSLFI